MLLQLQGHLVVAAFGYTGGGGVADSPESVAEGAKQACRCAQAVVLKLDKLVEAKKKKIAGGAEKRKAVELQVAVGVHTGTCCVGTVGHEKMLNLAVLGDAATLAWCMHAAAAAAGASIVVSADTHAQLTQAGFVTRPLARARVPRSWLPASGPSSVGGDTSPRVRRPSSGSMLTATEGPPSPSSGGGAAEPAAEMELAAVQLLPAKPPPTTEAVLASYAEALQQAEKGAWAAAASALKPALDAAPADGPSLALLAQCDAAERQQLSLVAAAAGRRLVLPPPFF